VVFIFLLFHFIMLYVASINIHGLRDPQKRQLFFQNCIDLKFDIICVQETYISTASDIEQLRRDWRGECFCSPGGSHSRGVAILVSPFSAAKLSGVRCDTEGRVLSVSVACNNASFSLCTVYAPNSAGARVAFFKDLFNYFPTNNELVLCGDFNCVYDLAADRFGPSSRSTVGVGDVQLRSICTAFGLTDHWRDSHPTARQYTWRNPPNTIGSRLDKFFVPNSWASDSFITSCSLSDHDFVHCVLKPPALFTPGPGVWKCNTSVLNDPLVQSDVREQYQSWVTLKAAFHSLTEWWDMVKSRFKQLIIKHSRRIAYERNAELKTLHKELDQLSSRLDAGDRSSTLRVEYNAVKEKLNALLLTRLRGAKVRAKSKHFQAGEKCSIFFIAKERRRSKRKVIAEVMNSNGLVVSDQASIASVFNDFYTNLYASNDNIDVAEQNVFLDHLTRSLSEEQKCSLEGVIQLRELHTALKNMRNGKSPGADGLPKEFYIAFWDLLGEDFLCVVRSALEEGVLSESQRMGLITLLSKPGGHLNPSNKRPISLLNVDYKIISKALTDRLKLVLPDIIGPFQTCGVMGRSIHQNVKIMRDVTSFANARGVGSAFVTLDQKKAFDRVDWSFLQKVLTRFNFGPIFRSWVSTLYRDISSSILINGHTSTPFHLYRGVRQGCPLSPLLYVMFIEPFAAAVQSCADIKGWVLPGCDVECKLLQYADDGTALINDNASFNHLFNWCNRFGEASGSALNMSKCKGLWLGKWRDRSDNPLGIKWTRDKLKINGVWIGEIDMARANWDVVTTKCVGVLKQWEDRKLDILSKVAVVNSLAAATLWYIAPLFNINRISIKTLSTAIFKFVWGSKKEMVKRDVVCLPCGKGGLALINIAIKSDAMFLHSTCRSIVSDVPCRYFLRAWATRRLHRHLGVDWSNLIAHFTDPPVYYKYFLDLCISNERLIANTLWRSTGVSGIYSKLMETGTERPRVVQRDPNRDWGEIFGGVHSPLLDGHLKALSWLVTHRVVKTNVLLSRWHVRYITPTCPIQGCRDNETVPHLFVYCNVPTVIWDWLSKFVYTNTAVTMDCNEDLVLDSIVASDFGKATQDVILFLVNVVKQCVWTGRCRAAFGESQPTGCDTLADVKRYVKIRLDCEKTIMSRKVFKKKWNILVNSFGNYTI
jgi:exonuclease III